MSCRPPLREAFVLQCEMMVDATQEFNEPLTKERLFRPHILSLTRASNPLRVETGQ